VDRNTDTQSKKKEHVHAAETQKPKYLYATRKLLMSVHKKYALGFWALSTGSDNILSTTLVPKKIDLSIFLGEGEGEGLCVCVCMRVHGSRC
jgi:hypothetical protein